MDPLLDDNFAYFKKISIFLGFWVNQPYRERVLRHYFFGSVCFYGVLQQTCPLFTMKFELDAISLLLQILVLNIVAVSMYCFGILHHETIKQIINFIIEDWQQSKIDTDFMIIKKYTNECKLHSLLCSAFSALFVGSFIILPVLHHALSTEDERSYRNDRFPMSICLDHFIDPKTHYYLSVVHQTLIVIIIISVLIIIIGIYFWFIQHSCAYLSMIKVKLRKPFREDDDLLIPIDLSHWVIDIVQRLTRIMKFLSLVNNLSENYLLLQISTAFLVITVDFLCIFQIPVLLEEEGKRRQVLSSLIYIFGTLLPFYLLCYMGQKLIDSSVDVYREACLVPIYKITPKTRKLLSIMMSMCAKPYALSIGKVSVVSHEIFRDLVRASLSFAMMVHTMQNI